MGKGQLTKAIGVGMGLVILGACRSSQLEADSCLADVEPMPWTEPCSAATGW